MLTWSFFDLDGPFCEVAKLIDVVTDFCDELFVFFGVEAAANTRPRLLEKLFAKLLIDNIPDDEWDLKIL